MTPKYNVVYPNSGRGAVQAGSGQGQNGGWSQAGPGGYYPRCDA